MKKFKYSLNKLLNMRLRLEKEASQKFTDISSKIKVIDDNIQTLNELYKKNAFATCSTKIEDIIKTNYNYYLENSIMLNKKEREKMSKEYEFRFEDYKNKKKDRMVLEKLRDKEYEEFLREQDKEEQDFLDELSLNMYYKEFEEGR
ncbi:flagellar export protein FliJ [Candidatus Arthromitus sp. SFB-turkey]|uniref:flagellar export protein FliJ n=1 Tax=Candidatus Arthromitus sp. SFB-turkey TaxID=1840217 RepID=UPI0007F54F81|nr:flagellar FliJ family protein [Candidatus Arthromitus sp. SFB-turkey]OAT86917.1 flagellar biosynthesis protein FliJ [Candidatus Arthromitus sp. SFB-turkey]HJC99852.1 flagellar FliJ family protein [Candidatus Dwaynia gallinarum]